MNIDELYSRFDKLCCLAQTIPELDEKETLDHVSGVPSIPAIVVTTTLAGLLAEDTAALLLEAEENAFTIHLSDIAESAAAAEALRDMGEDTDTNDPRSVQSFYNLAYIVARHFVNTRKLLALEELDEIRQAHDAGII